MGVCLDSAAIGQTLSAVSPRIRSGSAARSRGSHKRKHRPKGTSEYHGNLYRHRRQRHFCGNAFPGHRLWLWRQRHAFGGGSDTIYGGNDNDVLSGGTGNDYLYGGDHADTIYGGDQNDQAFGGWRRPGRWRHGQRQSGRWYRQRHADRRRRNRHALWR
ncbi:MAG: hypothetical protein HZT43_12320 [Exiguobacterium profundum]|nr:MAG: hypothetical protein HZT43_12320 [Exiguobacterium profundum]